MQKIFTDPKTPKTQERLPIPIVTLKGNDKADALAKAVAEQWQSLPATSHSAIRNRASEKRNKHGPSRSIRGNIDPGVNQPGR